jgi:hypothetical protein
MAFCILPKRAQVAKSARHEFRPACPHTLRIRYGRSLKRIDRRVVADQHRSQFVAADLGFRETNSRSCGSNW